MIHAAQRVEKKADRGLVVQVAVESLEDIRQQSKNSVAQVGEMQAQVGEMQAKVEQIQQEGGLGVENLQAMTDCLCVHLPLHVMIIVAAFPNCLNLVGLEESYSAA